MYSDTDCISVVQLAAWMYGKDVSDLTTTDYKQTGFSPSLPVFFDRFGDWSEVKRIARDSKPKVPTHSPVYYQSIASLRKAVTVTGYPLTSLDYQGIEDQIGVSYVDIINSVGPWTRAKRIACVHSEPISFSGPGEYHVD